MSDPIRRLPASTAPLRLGGPPQTTPLPAGQPAEARPAVGTDRLQVSGPGGPTPPPGGAIAPPPADALVAQRQAAEQAASWVQRAREGVTLINGGNGSLDQVAQAASLLRRPEQLAAARAALAPIAATDRGREALARLDELQQITTAGRANLEAKAHANLRRLTNPNRMEQGLGGISSEQARQDLQGFAAGRPESQAAYTLLAGRTGTDRQNPVGQIAADRPQAIAQALGSFRDNPQAHDAMLRQAVQGLVERDFGSVASGGAGTVQEATARLDRHLAALQAAGVDAGAIARARQAVTNDPANQTMLRNPGLNAVERLALDTGGAAAAAAGIQSMLDRTIGPLDPARPSDGIGVLSQLTDRIPPGESRTVALEGEARFGVVQLGAGAELTVARTMPQPTTRLQLTFTVGAHAAAGFQREFSKQTAVGSVSGQVEAQVRADGRTSFTYEFDTSNPQQMAQLRAMSGAMARAVPVIGGLVGGTEGPGVQEAFRGLSQRHVETRFEASVTATARLEATLSTGDRTHMLVARFEQARAGLNQVEALNTSFQDARGALGRTPPDFQAAFTAMQANLPAGAARAGQVALDAQRAQALYAEGKTGEALQLMRGYLPQPLQNATQVAMDAQQAYAAMNAGNAAEAFRLMQAHLPPSAQRAGQMAIDAQKAQQLYNEGKPEEAAALMRSYLPQGLQNVSQVALDGYRAQQLLTGGNATEAFTLMQQHLPAAAQRPGQAALDAQRAQRLIAEGKTPEALELLATYMPPGVQGSITSGLAGFNALNGVRAAFEGGDLQGGLAAMQGAITAGQGLAGALRQQAADLPGQIAAARAAVQTLREMPAQLRDQIQGLPGQAREQVQGLLTQASEQVQGLRAQAQALRDQAQALPATARAQAQALRAQAQGLTDQAQTRARALSDQARGLPATVRQGVMDRINAAVAAPASSAGPIGSVQLTGSGTARVSRTQNHRDGSTVTTFGLSGEGTVAAESRIAGQTGGSGARSADIAVTRGADGAITGVTITRSFEGSRFAATAGRELVGELDPQLIASVEATDRVAIVQQVDLNAAGITPDMASPEVARRLATLALRADPPPGTGRIVRATATRTESVQARADFVAGSVAVRLDRTRNRELRT